MTSDNKNFWSTLPGILTGIAAVLTAGTGLYMAVQGRTLPANSRGEVESQANISTGTGYEQKDVFTLMAVINDPDGYTNVRSSPSKNGTIITRVEENIPFYTYVQEGQSYKYTRAKNWGAVGWIKPLIDIMMAGASETTDYHLSRMFSARGKASSYISIQPASLGNLSVDMDNASKENLAALAEVGIETSENCSEELDRIVEVLLEGPDPVEFE